MADERRSPPRRSSDLPDQDHRSERQANDGYHASWGTKSIEVSGPLGVVGILAVLLVLLMGGSAYMGIQAIEGIKLGLLEQTATIQREYETFRESLRLLISRQRQEQFQQMCLMQIPPEILNKMRLEMSTGSTPRQVLVTYCPWLRWWTDEPEPGS